MTFSCIYDNKFVTKFTEGKIKLAVFQIISVREIKENRSAYCTSHLIHHSGCFVPVYILCILSNLCIIIERHFTVIEEVINDRTDQHLKRCRRADTCCCDNVCAHICIKSCSFESILLCTFHHSCHKCCCTFFVVIFAELCKVNYDLISVTFACNMNYLGSIRISGTNRIKINTSCNYFTAIVICMVTDDLRSSRCCEIFCFILFIDFCKIICKIFKTCTADFCFSINFLKFRCFW